MHLRTAAGGEQDDHQSMYAINAARRLKQKAADANRRATSTPSDVIDESAGESAPVIKLPADSTAVAADEDGGFKALLGHVPHYFSP
eukprot:jgi/Chrzof1/5519/Cz16g06040.t1